MVWSREERSLAAGLVVLALAGAGWLLAGRVAATGVDAAPGTASAGAGGVKVDVPAAAVASPPAGEAGSAEGPDEGSEQDPPVLVHVAGSVREPGVYRLPAGARVIDAVTAAGGPTEDAAVDAVNLAALVVDGSRLYIPSRDEIEAQGPPGGGSWPAGVAANTLIPGGDGALQPVAVNRAGSEELQRLPGIGPVLAERIIDYRRRNGPFQAVEDLLGVSGIGPKVLERIRPYVVVP